MVSLDGRPLLVPPSAPPYQGYQLHAGVFTPRQCRRIVDLAHGMRLDDALLEGVAGAEIADEGIRRSRTAWIPPSDESWWIYDKLAKVVAKANRTYRFDLTGFAEDLQFTAYDEPGAFYGWHQDGLDGAVAVRKLSIVVQLTPPDEYEGCSSSRCSTMTTTSGSRSSPCCRASWARPSSSRRSNTTV